MESGGQYTVRLVLYHLCLAHDRLLVSTLFFLALASHAASTGITRATRPIISDINNQEVSVGSTVTFDCRVRSLAVPAIHWWKTDESGSRHELRAIADKIDILINTPRQENVYSQTLKIYRVTLEDAGSYICYAGITAGTSSESAQLTVSHVIIASPPIISPMGSQNVRVGSTATFDCHVQSTTPTTFEWWKTETQSSSTGRLEAIPKKIDIRVNNPLQEDVYSQTLRIYSVTKEDAGNYMCYVENTVGSSTKIAELEVTSAPPKNKPPPKKKPPPRRGGCMKFSAPGPAALILMLLCGYALGNHNLFFG